MGARRGLARQFGKPSPVQATLLSARRGFHWHQCIFSDGLIHREHSMIDYSHIRISAVVCALAANAASAAAEAAQAAASAIAPASNRGSAATQPPSATGSLPLGQLVRSKGHVWLASRHDMRGDWSHAGRVLRVDCGGPWYAAMPDDRWPLHADDERREEVRAPSPLPPCLDCVRVRLRSVENSPRLRSGNCAERSPTNHLNVRRATRLGTRRHACSAPQSWTPSLHRAVR
jgi:hypothetical protein